MDEPVYLAIEEYPNLDAILSGTIPGNFQLDWPLVRPELIRLVAERDKFHKALKEIRLGQGRFSTDLLTHASNTIEDMKQIANKVL